ncbi:tetratricopeptide repeat protein, partial [Amycolatopsis thailandensis]|uniref:tetratricopeptide repeat protein n=1 Tax=Amycolatopsis thailandensis TaxID=589330 RepID=UPI003658E935
MYQVGNGTLTVYQHAAPSGAESSVETVTAGEADLFVGRAVLVGELLDALAPSTGTALVTAPVVVSAVAGMGGVGKTALARHVARTAAGRNWFAAAFVVNLQGYDPDPAQRASPRDVVGSLLRGFGVDGAELPVTVPEQLTLYQHILGAWAADGRRVLLVLDNASAGEQVAALLPTATEHRVVITTRDTLALPTTARTVDLDVLTDTDAQELLERLLRRATPADPRVHDTDAMAAVVRWCGRLPLAVEIAAALLIEDPSMTVAGLAQELRDSPVRLESLEFGEKTVTAVLALSWHHLLGRNPGAARVLRLLPLNPGPDISTTAAAALAGCEQSRVLPWLRALRHAHLLYHESGRWRMHDLVNLYARDRGAEHAAQDDPVAATTRLLAHYTDTADAADDHLRALAGQPTPDRFAGRQDALDWFDAERTNLIAAVAHAHHTGQLRYTTSLAACLSEYLSWRRHLNDWVAVATHATTAATTLDQPRTSARAWSHLGLALQEVRRFDDAITAHHHELDIFRALGDRHGEGTAWNNLGLALRALRRFDDAITAHHHDLDICRALGDRHGEASAWNNLGSALQAVRRFDDAVTAHHRARDIYQELGDRHREGMAWNNLGLALQEVRRFDDAVTAHHRARDIYQELGDRHREGSAWNNLGLALRALRRFDDAITAHHHDLDICRA